MLTRRTLLLSAGALVTMAEGASGQAPTPSVRPGFQHDLPELNLSGWSLTAVEVSYGPGEGSGAHRHPGLTIAYVLEGSIRSKVGDAAEQTYTAGQMFIEAPEQVHAVSRNASNTESAKLLAILLTRKGAVLTTPVKQ